MEPGERRVTVACSAERHKSTAECGARVPSGHGGPRKMMPLKLGPFPIPKNHHVVHGAIGRSLEQGTPLLISIVSVVDVGCASFGTSVRFGTVRGVWRSRHVVRLLSSGPETGNGLD